MRRAVHCDNGGDNGDDGDDDVRIVGIWMGICSPFPTSKAAACPEKFDGVAPLKFSPSPAS
jgi:hypothetical protein